MEPLATVIGSTISNGAPVCTAVLNSPSATFFSDTIKDNRNASINSVWLNNRVFNYGLNVTFNVVLQIKYDMRFYLQLFSFLYTILCIVCREFEPRRMARSLLNRLESGTIRILNYAILWRIDEMNKDWASMHQSEFVVTNKRTDLKIIPYIGCKAGFKDILIK